MPSTEVSLSAVHPAVAAPTTAEVDAISIIANPVIRNLKITQCYFELSSAFAARTGMCATGAPLQHGHLSRLARQ
jgi:hypothetical protein